MSIIFQNNFVSIFSLDVLYIYTNIYRKIPNFTTRYTFIVVDLVSYALSLLTSGTVLWMRVSVCIHTHSVNSGYKRDTFYYIVWKEARRECVHFESWMWHITEQSIYIILYRDRYNKWTGNFHSIKLVFGIVSFIWRRQRSLNVGRRSSHS